ncbi:hypothetical protein ACK3Y9_10935, partial [Aeromonas caviae]
IDWIGHTEYSETRIEQLDHIFNLIGIISLHDHLRLAEWHPRFIRGHTYRQFRDDSTICLAEQKPVAIVTWNQSPGALWLVGRG